MTRPPSMGKAGTRLNAPMPAFISAMTAKGPKPVMTNLHTGGAIE